MNILVIGDLHTPFEHENALKFVKSVYDNEDINEVVFMGDVVDNHAVSYHESDPDGLSAGDELECAINSLRKWHAEFPYAKVCIGNHDVLPNRKAFTGGISSRWMKGLREVLETPTWDFQPYHEIGRWFFSHGVGQLVHTRAADMDRNCVAGHKHSRFEANYRNGNWSIFAGALVDDNSYAMAYGKWDKKTKLGVVVIKDAMSDNPEIKMIPMNKEMM
jgi:predicted phosphodiesterase